MAAPFYYSGGMSLPPELDIDPVFSAAILSESADQ
jgi:hypothetical protein